MGIKNLMKLIQASAPAAVKEITLKELLGRKVAIDASMAIYSFLVSAWSQVADSTAGALARDLPQPLGAPRKVGARGCGALRKLARLFAWSVGFTAPELRRKSAQAVRRSLSGAPLTAPLRPTLPTRRARLPLTSKASSRAPFASWSTACARCTCSTASHPLSSLAR